MPCSRRVVRGSAVLGDRKRAGCVAKVASGALLGLSWTLVHSSTARFASQERFGSDFGSILRPSGPQKPCWESNASMIFIKLAIPPSISILSSKSPPKMTSWTPQWRSRRVQSVSRAPQEHPQTLLKTLFGRLWGLLGRSWVPLGRFGAPRAFLGVPPRLFGSYF